MELLGVLVKAQPPLDGPWEWGDPGPVCQEEPQGSPLVALAPEKVSQPREGSPTGSLQVSAPEWDQPGQCSLILQMSQDSPSSPPCSQEGPLRSELYLAIALCWIVQPWRGKISPVLCARALQAGSACTEPSPAPAQDSPSHLSSPHWPHSSSSPSC